MPETATPIAKPEVAAPTPKAPAVGPEAPAPEIAPGPDVQRLVGSVRPGVSGGAGATPPPPRPPTWSSRASSMPRELLALQRMAGNGAVSGLITKSRLLTPIMPGSGAQLAPATAAPAMPAPVQRRPSARRPAGPLGPTAPTAQRQLRPTVQRDDPKNAKKPDDPKKEKKQDDELQPEELYVFANTVDNAAKVLGQVTQQLKDKSEKPLDVVIIGLDATFLRVYDRQGNPLPGGGPIPLELPKGMRFDPGIFVIPPGGGPSRRLRLDPKSGRVGIYEVAGVLVDADPKAKAKAAAGDPKAPATEAPKAEKGKAGDLEDVGKGGADKGASGPSAFDLRKYMKDSSALDSAVKGHEGAGQFFVVPHPLQGGSGKGKPGGARTTGFAGELEGKGPPPNAPPWPVSMDGPKLQPADSQGVFTSRINWTANGNNTLASATISAVGNYIHYRWEVYDVTQFAKRQSAATAKQARQTQAVINAANEKGIAPPDEGGAAKPGAGGGGGGSITSGDGAAGGGSIDGPATGGDQHPVQPKEPDPDAHALDEAVERGTTAKAGSGMDPRAATRNRAFRRSFEELWDDTKRSGKDLAKPSGSTLAERQINAQGNLLAVELLPVSFVITSLGATMRLIADLFSGPSDNQEINFESEGVYLVRVITTPSVTTDLQGNDVIRPSSVASKVVEVVSMDRMLKEGLDEPGAQLKEADKALAEANKSKDKDRIAEATEAKQLKELEVGGDPVKFLELKLQIRNRDLVRAKEKWGPVRGPILEIERDIDIIEERLKVYQLQNRRRGTGETVTAAQRVTATLVSEVTGQTYPLMLSVGPTSEDKEGARVWKLLDATGQDAEGFTGHGTTEFLAIWDAFRQFGNKAGYGRGKIGVRIPTTMTPGGAGPGKEFQIDSKPLAWAVARGRIDDLVMTLAAIGLFVTTAGTASIAIGAAVAAARLIDRAYNGTLRFDATAVSDVLAILGAVGAAGQAIAGLRVASAGVKFEAVGKDMVVMLEEGAAVGAKELKLAGDAMKSAANVLKGVEMANEIINYAGVVWGNVNFFSEMLEVAALEAMGPPAGITHAEARRRRAAGIAGAINNNGMVVAPHVIKGLKARKAGKTGAPSETPAPAGGEGADGGAKPKAGTGEHTTAAGDGTTTGKDAAAPHDEGQSKPSEQPVEKPVEKPGEKPTEPSTVPKVDPNAGPHAAQPGEPGHAGGTTTPAGPQPGGGKSAAKPSKKSQAKQRSAAHKSLIEAARTGQGLEAAAREAIGKGGTWKEQLKGAVGKLEGDHRIAAEKALVQARKDLVKQAWEKIKASDPRFKDLKLDEPGTTSFGSDIDATVRPTHEEQATGPKMKEQIEASAEAARQLQEALQKAVGGEIDALIDTNVYSFIGEGKVKAGDAAGKGQQSHVDSMVGLAEQMRGQSKKDFDAFKKRLTEKVKDPAVVKEVERILDQAKDFNQARQDEWKAATKESAAKNKSEPKAVQERMARDALLGKKKGELADLLGAKPPDLDAIARKQAEINWFAPDAYATPSAFKQAVAHGQRLKGTEKSTADWTGNDVAAKLREAAGKLAPDDPRAGKLKREASLAESQQSTLTEILKDLKKAQDNAPVDVAAVKELEAQANGLRKEIARAAERIAIAEILDLTTPADQPGPERVAEAAAASAANVGMMDSHVAHAKDIDGKVKAAAKYAGRVAMAEMLSGLRPATDPIARLIGEFVKSRWGILENVSPQVMRDMFVKYAELTGRQGELAYNERGEAVGATDKLKQAFVNDVQSWGRSTNQDLQGAALTSKAYNNPTPALPPPTAEHVAKGKPAPDGSGTGGKPIEGAAKKEPPGGKEESPAPTEERPKPAAPEVITGSGGVTSYSESPLINPPGRNQLFDFRLKSLREGDRLLRRLANGDPAALAEQGVQLPKGYKTQAREFGLAQLPDGTYAIVQGDYGAVAWDGLPPGTIPLAHTHPITPERALSKPGTVKEILSHLGAQDHWGDPTDRGKDAVHIGPSAEDVLFCAANKVVNHDVHTGYVHTGDGVLKTPTGAPGEIPVSFNLHEARHIGNATGGPVVEAGLVAHDANGNVLYIGRVFAARTGGGHTMIQYETPMHVEGPPDPTTLTPLHAPAGAAPTSSPAPTNKAGGTNLPDGMQPAAKTGATRTAAGGKESEIPGGTIVDKDDFSTTVKSKRDPTALVRLEVDGQTLKLTDIFRRNLPPGTGVTLLAQALREVHAGPGFELIIHGIINPETLDALKSGMSPLESKLGKTAERALAAIGLTPRNARWEMIRGKQCIVMDID